MGLIQRCLQGEASIACVAGLEGAHNHLHGVGLEVIAPDDMVVGVSDVEQVVDDLDIPGVAQGCGVAGAVARFSDPPLGLSLRGGGHWEEVPLVGPC